jgi:hypothetical protein
MADNKVSRRQLAAAVAGALPALAQTGAAQRPPLPGDDLNASAREQLKRSSEALAKTEVPILLEPSFTFQP